MSLIYNGTTTYASIANESAFDFDRTDPFSFSFWCKGTVSETTIFSKLTIGGNYTGWEIATPVGQVRWQFISLIGSARLLVDSTSRIDDGLWHHVAITQNGGRFADCGLYVDGVDEGTNIIDTLTSGSTLNNVVPRIGRRNDNTIEYSGQITDMVVWGAELTAAEVLAIYASKMKYSALLIKQSDLVSYWPANDQPHGTAAVGETMADVVGGNDGTIVNSGTWQGETLLSYPGGIIVPGLSAAVFGGKSLLDGFETPLLRSVLAA